MVSRVSPSLEPQRAPAAPDAEALCFHCGSPCGPTPVQSNDQPFCCHGCRVVHDLLTETGLGHFYDLRRHPGVRVVAGDGPSQWAHLDAPEVREKLVEFSDGRTDRVTFHVPAIHCIACVWLLENLFRLHPALGRSQVHFPRREVTIAFQADQVRLSEVAALLDSIGYTPRLTLGELERAPRDRTAQRRWLQLGIAGFAFGNIMLFSLPGYLGLDSLSGPLFQRLFGYLSLVLALPVLIYSAGDYWRSAWVAFRQRILTLDIPIALGLAALYAQSATEILVYRGEGYLDSLAGLVFFLLCGRAFQQKTQERLAFDRDYKAFFPLSVARRTAQGEERVALSSLRVGDHLIVKQGGLIPADATLVAGSALIDYSFVTGEAEPVARQPRERLFAGGRQMGGTLEVEIVKPVSESYLTSLWSHDAFRQPRGDDFDTVTHRYSRRFTRLVVGIALGAAAWWFAAHQPATALKAFTSVLIVACPCALALAAPFTLGTAQRLLARAGVYVKNAHVVERLAQVDTIVLDKTGTLTRPRTQTAGFQGTPLTADEARDLGAVVRQSSHPLAAALASALPSDRPAQPVDRFAERPGGGCTAWVGPRPVVVGSADFLAANGISVPLQNLPPGSQVHIALAGTYRGVFLLTQPLRPEVERCLQALGTEYALALLSGDQNREPERFGQLLGRDVPLHFNQGPLDKLNFIAQLQAQGRRVMMVGDGLNDAGALQQSDVGVAVVDQTDGFSPASDLILPGAALGRLPAVLALARRAVTLVRTGFVISAVYNAIGIGIAAAGLLSPVICAVLMPLSSASVVLFATGATSWAARRWLGSVPGKREPKDGAEL